MGMCVFMWYMCVHTTHIGTQTLTEIHTLGNLHFERQRTRLGGNYRNKRYYSF